MSLLPKNWIFHFTEFRPKKGTQTDSTIPRLHGPDSNNKDGILHISSNARTGASPLDSVLCHIKETHLGWFYNYVEMQSTYSSAMTNWAGL